VDTKADKVLVNCFGPCTAEQRIDALRERGLWYTASGVPAGRKNTPHAMAWAYVTARGELIATKERTNLPNGKKKFTWRMPNGKASSGDVEIAALPVYNLPAVLAAPTGAVIVLNEGEKAADATPGQVGTSLAGGSSQTDFGVALEALRDRRVALSPDNADDGHAFMHRVADGLAGVNASVCWLALPYLPPKGDMYDFVDAGGDAAQLATLIEQAPADCPTCSGATLPSIRTDDRNFDELVNEALAALVRRNEPPALFIRAGTLVRVCRDEDGRPLIASHTVDSVRMLLAESASWYHLIDKARKPRQEAVSPPSDVARTALALGEWPNLPALTGITQSPILHADGSLHHQEGYDARSRLWHTPPDGFTMPALPDTPTTADIVAAVLLIDDLIVDFPFLGPADRATFWAALMTATLRPLIDGPTPLFIFDKPRAGTGASLLAELVALIATGEEARMKTLGQDRGGEETRKLITSALIAGDPLIIFDNVDAAIASGHLAAALTARTWEDRILGKSEMARLPVRVSWLATGNNIRVRGDIARRSLVCRLDARVDRPWERTGFRHPHLLAHVATHRGELLAALLTIARGWIQAGRPAGDNPTLGSFEGWSTTIGGILTHAGIPALLANIAAFYEAADEDYAEWAGFLEVLHGWAGGQPFTVAELARKLDPIDGLEKLRDALPGPLAAALGKPTLRHQLGRALAGKAEARYDGHRLTKAGTRDRAVRWQVFRDEPPPPAGQPHEAERDESNESTESKCNPSRGGNTQSERAHVFTHDEEPQTDSSDSSDSLDSPACPDCDKAMGDACCWWCNYAICAGCNERTLSALHPRCRRCSAAETQEAAL
jgi:hypothetical protein